MPQKILIIILNLVERELNRRATREQKKDKSSPTFVNNGTINIDIHASKDLSIIFLILIITLTLTVVSSLV